MPITYVATLCYLNRLVNAIVKKLEDMTKAAKLKIYTNLNPYKLTIT